MEQALAAASARLFRRESVSGQDSCTLFDGNQLIGCYRFESFFEAVRPDNLDVRGGDRAAEGAAATGVQSRDSWFSSAINSSNVPLPRLRKTDVDIGPTVFVEIGRNNRHSVASARG